MVKDAISEKKKEETLNEGNSRKRSPRWTQSAETVVPSRRASCHRKTCTAETGSYRIQVSGQPKIVCRETMA